MDPGHVGQARRPEREAREEFPQAGVGPKEEGPASVLPHLEPLRAPRDAMAMEAGDEIRGNARTGFVRSATVECSFSF